MRAAAAVAGGFTAVACMPNTRPVNDNAGVTELILKKAADAGLARVYPIGAVSRGQQGEQLADIAELKHAGCVAISDDGHPVSTALLARRAMEYAGMFGMPLIEHCEDPSLKGEGVAHEGPVAASLGLKGIPGIAEAITAGRDILIAEMVGGHVHVAHMSAWTTLEAVRQGKSRGVQVTCEVAPHHFTLTDELLAAPVPYDTDAKMNPPLREARDRDAMLRPASPTAASTSSPPITPRTTPTRRTSSSTARRSASSAWRRPFPSPSTGWSTRGVHPAAAAGRADVGQPGAHPQSAGRQPDRGRSGRHHHPGARPAGDGRPSGAGQQIEEHAVPRLDVPRRGGGDAGWRTRGLSQPRFRRGAVHGGLGAEASAKGSR